MVQKISNRAEKYLKAGHRKRQQQKLLTFLACIVVFCTVYALIMPAVTLGSNPLSGDAAYINKIAMGTSDQAANGGITDGSAPWDSSDVDGLDKANDNKRVRTFDTVKYDFYYETTSYNTTSHYDSALIYFEFLMPVNKQQAVFVVDSMNWLKKDNVYYTYEEELFNIKGTDYQVLHGSFLDYRENSDITAASKSLNATVRVLNMQNGSQLQPIFSIWIENNDVGVTYENYIPNGVAYNNGHKCGTHDENEVKSVLPDPVAVTCTPRYAVTLKRGEASLCSYKDSFDFFTGNEEALEKDIGVWNGEMDGYGIRLMVKGLDAEHGLKGCSFPQSDESISFTLTLTATYQLPSDEELHDITAEFTPRVWSADEFEYGTQGDGREVNGYNGAPSYGAPLNSGKNHSEDEKRYTCKNGGTWTFSEPITEDGVRKIQVNVKGYEFDPEQLPHTYERGSKYSSEFYNLTDIGTNYWNIENAVFSTGEIWVLTPFYNAPGTNPEYHIVEVKGSSNISLWQDIYANDLKVTDSSDKIIFSKQGQNDHLNTSVYLSNSGYYTTACTLLKPLTSTYNDSLISDCCDGTNALMDYATPGTYVDLEAWTYNDSAEGDDTGVAYNNMIKFDDACFELVTFNQMTATGYTGSGIGVQYKPEYYASSKWHETPSYESCGDYDEEFVSTLNGSTKDVTILFGTTKDKQGWNHKGLTPDQKGYDEEMMKATPDDLIWYTSMKSLTEDGATCVAVMAEYRNVANDGTNKSNKSSMNHLHTVAHARVKDTADPNYVYAISNYSAAWTKSDVKGLVADESGDGKIGTMDYLYYTRYNFPSYSPDAANNMDSGNFPQPTHERSWNRCSRQARGESGVDELNGNNGYGTAIKTYLDDSGTLISGSGGNLFQDNLYLISYKSNIGIQIAQTAADETEKTNYSMDNNQRVVDYKVLPKFIRSSADSSICGETTTLYTDATIVITLPQGLEYYPDTAKWGGEYSQDSTCQSAGTVIGGEALETTIVQNEDGTSTLTWVLKNVPLSQSVEELDPIYFSCRIGSVDDSSNDVTNNQSLEVTADIYSTADPGALHGTDYNNRSSKSITVTKATALSIIKVADNSILEAGNTMGFTMSFRNDSQDAYTAWIVDVLPQNGIDQSSFNGELQLDEFTILSGIDDTSGLSFYYTTDTDVSGLTDVTSLDVTRWSSFELDENKSWKPNQKSITAIAFEYSIPGQTIVKMHTTLSLPDGKSGDIIQNKLFLNSLITSDISRIVKRTIEGLAWMDNNADGIQNDGDDSVLSDVKVSLYKLREGTTLTTKFVDKRSYFQFGDSVIGGLTTQVLSRVRIVANIPSGARMYYGLSGVNDTNLKEQYSIAPSTEVYGSELEYVYDFRTAKGWDATSATQVLALYWMLPSNTSANSMVTLKSVTVDLTDGTSLAYNYTDENFLTSSYFYPRNFCQSINNDYTPEPLIVIDPANESHYSPYYYSDGTLAEKATDSGGRYSFTDLPDGTYGLVFSDGTTKISSLIASPVKKGQNDDLDSDGVAEYSSDRSILNKTVILGIDLPKIEDMSASVYESKFHDSGFYERGYELPKSGGNGTSSYLISGLVFFGASFLAYVFLKSKKHAGKH